jgi:hypothetical protein
MLVKSTHTGKTMNIQSVWRPLSSRSSAQAKPSPQKSRGGRIDDLIAG